MKWFIALALVVWAGYWLFSPEGQRAHERIMGSAANQTQIVENE